MKTRLYVCSKCLKNNREVEWSTLPNLCAECAKEYRAKWNDTRFSVSRGDARYYAGRESREALCKYFGKRNNKADVLQFDGTYTEDVYANGNKNFYEYEKALLLMKEHKCKKYDVASYEAIEDE